MWPNPQETADLVTFTEEFLNGKLHFLCSGSCWKCWLTQFMPLVFLRLLKTENFWLSDVFRGCRKRLVACNELMYCFLKGFVRTLSMKFNSARKLIILNTPPANIYLFKFNNRNRKRCEICSKLTIKTPERHQWRRSDVLIANFEQMVFLLCSYFIVLVFLLLIFKVWNLFLMFLLLTSSK